MPRPPQSSKQVRPGAVASRGEQTDGGDDGGAQVRLQRLLAMAGVGSRRHCEEFILAGRVTVDRQTVSELGVRVDPARQVVRLDGERIATERQVYYILNKPIGFLCTNADPAGRSRVIDLFPKMRERLFTVGRLDEHSQGLLLVTNDGALAHQLAHPRFRVPKVYRVQVVGVPNRELLDKLRSGMYFAEGKFQVEGVKLVRVKAGNAQLELVLTEGQNREIRRLLARLGHKVLRLERIALGPLKLGPLVVGEYRALTPAELQELRRFAAGERGAARRGKPPRRKGAARARPARGSGSAAGKGPSGPGAAGGRGRGR